MSSEEISVRFMLQGAKHQPLSKEEEFKHLRLAKKGNKASRDLLIEANQRFIVRYAQKFRNKGLSQADLIQEGNLGLIVAIDRYDTRRRCRLVSYAGWWVRLFMQRAVDQKTRTVNIPMNKIIAKKRILDFEYGFVKQHGRQPNISEIAQAVGLKEEKVFSLYYMGTSSVSLQAEDDEGQTLENCLEFDIRENLTDTIYLNELTEKVLRVLSELSPREQAVIRYRYGLGEHNEPNSLRQTADHLGLSAEGIRQIQAHALSKLRDPERYRAILQRLVA